MDDVLAIILGGGRGQRLFPLTQKRSKPAVPFGGKYRLIDVPVSTCINSGVRRMFVLTQFNSESLNQHIKRTYAFDSFSNGFVSLLAAEQTNESESWFQGTADAVRRSMHHMARHKSRDIAILAGDQLYHLDLHRMVEAHRTAGADATVGVLPVPAEDASAFGILKLDAEGRIIHFEEKPSPDRFPDLMSDLPGGGRGLLASMGIYVFDRKSLDSSLETSGMDFGRHIIPDAVARRHVRGYVHRGYWEDLGTIRSYFKANLALADTLPPFDFYAPGAPIYTHPRFLPASKVESCNLRRALLSEGCIVGGATIDQAIIGIRTRIGAGSTLRNAVILGADTFETIGEMNDARQAGIPPMGIGEETLLENVIVDKNARIGRGVRIAARERLGDVDGPDQKDGGGPMYFVRDGIVVVPKGATVPDGTVI